MRPAAPSRTRAIILAFVLALTSIGLTAPAAHAATTLTVTTTLDPVVDEASCTPAGGGVSLRSAACEANKVGTVTNRATIVLGADTYTLTQGALVVGTTPGAHITIRGAGAATTMVEGNGSEQVFNLDPQMLGNVTVEFTDLSITGGADDLYGGGAIIGGSGSAPQADTLVLTRVKISGNTANMGAGASPASPGGGIQFIGGTLYILESVIENNQSGIAAGGGVAYQGMGVPGEQLHIDNTVFRGNTASATSGENGGAALEVTNLSDAASMSIHNSRFENNTVIGPSTNGGAHGAAIRVRGGALGIVNSTFTQNSLPASHVGGPARGSAIHVAGGATVTVNDSTFTNNTTAGALAGAAVHAEGGATLKVSESTFTGNTHPASAEGTAIHAAAGATLTANYNRFIGNTGGHTMIGAGASSNAEKNWWGCPGGPGIAGCGTATGVDSAPWLTLTATAAPVDITEPAGTATLTASLLKDSAGGTVAASDLTAFQNLAVTWGAPLPSPATVSPSTSTISGGVATATYRTNGARGPGSATATLDGGSSLAPLDILYAPAFSSAASATAIVGDAFAVTVAVDSHRDSEITRAGMLPAGITFSDNGNDTATIAGTAAAGSGGVYTLTLTAQNSVGSATQTFTLRVEQRPQITSPDAATFTVGQAGTRTLAASGWPAPSVSVTGALPAGVSFSGGALTGTPEKGTGGLYPLTITADNGVDPDASQTFTLTVLEDVEITLQPAPVTAHAGTAVAFTAAARGYPVPTVQWQLSTNNGASYTDIGGATSPSLGFTAQVGERGNLYRAVFTAGADVQATVAARLTVGTAPAFTSPGAATFQVHSGGQSYPITVAGVPQATIEATSGLPGWLSLIDNGDGTATLSGTPPAGSGGLQNVTLRASNGFDPVASQTLTLTVNEAPRLLPLVSTVFRVGSPVSAVMETAHAYPAPPSITLLTGTLPDGLTLTDNGAGSATLSGTPAAGAGGVYEITVRASNSAGSSDRTYAFTVHEAPVVTSHPANQSVLENAVVTLTAAATGYPAPTVQWQRSNDDGANWDDVAGARSLSLSVPTPIADTGVQYRAVFSNAVADVATNPAVIAVGTAPQITSLDSVLFPADVPTSFTVTATGYPAPAFSVGLPTWLTFVDHGDGTGTLSGTATAGGRTELVTIAASNGYGVASQDLDVVVADPPSFTSPDVAGFTVGTAGVFPILIGPGSAPTTNIAVQGSLPDGLSFRYLGNSTAEITGTPSPGAGGKRTLTVTATNTVGLTAQQTLTITVNETPQITSADTVTFTRGVQGSFTVTSDAGYPTATTVTLAGVLPAGLTWMDNGDGTVTLSGLTKVAPGTHTVTVTPANSEGTGSAQTLTIKVDPARAVPLPLLPPLGNGPIAGLPAEVTPGRPFSITGDGFAGFDLITIGMYSTPTVLGTVTADASGQFTAMVTIPAGTTGTHRLVASGLTPTGTERFLMTEFSIAAAPAAPTVSASPAPAAAELPRTGADAAGGTLLAGLTLLLVGLGLLVMRQRRRRA